MPNTEVALILALF